MGNHRFKLSDMMPNAWFYKLRDMSRVKKNAQSSAPIPRKSFYRADTKLCISPQNPKFYDPPRKAKRKTIYMPSPRKTEPEIPVWLKPSNIHDYLDDCRRPTSPDRADFPVSGGDSFDDQSYMSPCSCKLSSDIIIDVDDTEFDMISEPDLPPIQTKPRKQQQHQQQQKVVVSTTRSKRSSTSPGGRKSFSGGVRIRGGGRKHGSRKAEGRRRKSVKEEKKGMFYTESFAIVKASFDPEKDFRESMMEMIMENNIRNSKDLEELLACYLSLNSNQYHDLIIKAFEQIWFNIPQLHC